MKAWLECLFAVTTISLNRVIKCKMSVFKRVCMNPDVYYIYVYVYIVYMHYMCLYIMLDCV